MKNVILIALFLFQGAIAQSQIVQLLAPLPPETSPTNGPTQGFFFTAQDTMTITGVKVPSTIISSTYAQSIAILKFNGGIPPNTVPTTNYSTEFLIQNSFIAGIIPCNVFVDSGEVIGVIGSRFDPFSNVEQSSNTAATGVNTIIHGAQVPLTRLTMNSPLGTQLPTAVWTPGIPTATIVRVEMYYWGCSAPGFDSTSVVKPICNGDTVGSISLYEGPNGPFEYDWSTGDTVSSLTNLSAGAYSLTVTDTFGCELDTIILVTQPQPVGADFLSTNQLCNGNLDGTATVQGIGGTNPYSYLWSTGATTLTQNMLAAGIYTVTVTDDNGCTGVDSVEITEPDVLLAHIDSTVHVICPGDTNGQAFASVTGGTVPYSVSWTDPMAQTTLNPINLAEGSYTMFVVDSNGCMANHSLTIQALNPLPVVDLGPDTTAVMGDTLVLDGPPFQMNYQWSTGSFNQSIDVTSAGTYWLRVVDTNGCINSDTIEVDFKQPVDTNDTNNTGVGNGLLLPSQVQMFPNPAHGRVTISLLSDQQRIHEISLVDMLGHVVLRRKVNAQLVDLELAGIRNGLYFVVIQSDQGQSLIRRLSVY